MPLDLLHMKNKQTVTMMEPANDGGIVLALFLMVTAIAFAVFKAVAVYENATRGAAADPGSARLLRLLSGWANLGNAIVHVLLTVYTLANAGNESAYWVAERALGGIEGPVGLAIFNGAAGMAALRGFGMTFPLGWNAFVVVAGTCLPVVWPRFLEEGLAAWPYVIVFVWFSIFACELAAATCSIAHFAIVRGGGDAKKTK